MEHSLRLKKFYDGKKAFDLIKKAKLTEMAELKAISGDSVPDDPDAMCDFIIEHLSVATSIMEIFEPIAHECNEVQDTILDLTRYSSFLDQIIPYKQGQVTSKITASRDALCRQRTLFVESLVNDDMISSRTLSSVNATFVEIANMEKFFRPFGEFLAASNMADSGLNEEVAEDYQSALSEIMPGAILSLVIGVDESKVFTQQLKLIDDLRNQETHYARVDTDQSVLCWPVSRSYLDLPSRLLGRAGINPSDGMKRLVRMSKSIAGLKVDEQTRTGLVYLADWSVIIRNGLITIAAITHLFVNLLDATLDCLWEFFFYQLKQLEKREEFEVLESVLVMCQQTLFEEVVE